MPFPAACRPARRLCAAGLTLGLAACSMTGGPPAAPLPEIVLPAPAPAAAAMAATPFAAYVRGAVLTGPGAAASIARVAEAGAEAEGAAHAYRPDLSLSLDAAAEGVLGSGGSSGLVPALRLTRTLFDGGAGRRRAEAAEARLSAAEADQAAALARLAFEVVEAIAALELARREAALAEADRAAHVELLDGIAARATAGAGTEGEVLTARGRLAASETDAILAAAEARAAATRLDELAGGVRPEPPPLPAAPRLGAVPIGGADTPDLAGRRAAVAAAEADLAAATARQLPALSLNLTAARALGDGEDVTAGLGLDQNLDLRGERRAAVIAAEARLAEARAELIAAERAAERQALQADDALATATAAAGAATRAVEAERAAFAATETEVSLGRRPSGALLDARRDLTRAERALARAETDLRIAGWQRLARDGAILSALGLPLPGAARLAVVTP